MIDILKTKFLLLLRKPAGFIIITIIICTFAYILGLGQQSKMPIAVYSDLDQEQTEAFLLELKEIPEIDFTLYDEEEAIEMVKDGNTDVAVHLMEKKFELIISPSYLDAALLKNQLNRIYGEFTQQQAIIEAYDDNPSINVEEIIESADAQPSFQIQYLNFSNDGDFVWNPKLHSLFGFTLFMVIYTVANGVAHIVMERRTFIWDRLRISAIGKTEVYLANVIYCFLIGYLQVVLVLSIFYVGGVDFYGGFGKTLLVVIPYLLCIVALAFFIASVAGTSGRFNAYISVLAVPLAMLGGAYWPLEIVSSKAILALSYVSPITYGLDLLNGVTIHSSSMNELVQPLGVLLFMTIIFMGIGINVMEKKEQL
ncbi:ABC transporter permease [Lysinibacillus halotolerans]|uniref:ABC transporter permease n=1 Tax=Lysinibacillus halotolerans TaxID=1368476 RepID=A0A3M8HA16_9BACI|nr:ABC transporter permease [Lysinibacillus halotolerans]RNC99242.1 ABC transporter permease [Lysinibacillus halotolerans]